MQVIKGSLEVDPGKHIFFSNLKRKDGWLKNNSSEGFIIRVAVRHPKRLIFIVHKNELLFGQTVNEELK